MFSVLNLATTVVALSTSTTAVPSTASTGKTICDDNVYGINNNNNYNMNDLLKMDSNILHLLENASFRSINGKKWLVDRFDT
eukprot:Pgem_evm1s12744